MLASAVLGIDEQRGDTLGTLRKPPPSGRSVDYARYRGCNWSRWC